MKPPSFDYYDPTTIGETINLLARYGTEARMLAGGQSLVPQLNFRQSTPAVIVDLTVFRSFLISGNRAGKISLFRRYDPAAADPILRPRSP